MPSPTSTPPMRVVPLNPDVAPEFVRLCNLAWTAAQDADVVTLTHTFGDLTVSIHVHRDGEDPDA